MRFNNSFSKKPVFYTQRTTTDTPMQGTAAATNLPWVAIGFCCFSIASESRSTTEARPRVHAVRVDFFWQLLQNDRAGEVNARLRGHGLEGDGGATDNKSTKESNEKDNRSYRYDRTDRLWLLSFPSSGEQRRRNL